MPSEKLTGFSFAARSACSSSARWFFGMPTSVACCLPDGVCERGSDDVQRLHVAGKAALRLDLQEAGDVRLGQLGHFDVRRQRPLQRQAHDALALAHPDGVEVVANLPANQFGIIGQGVERERDGEGSAGLCRAPSVRRRARPSRRLPSSASPSRDERRCRFRRSNLVNLIIAFPSLKTSSGAPLCPGPTRDWVRSWR